MTHLSMQKGSGNIGPGLQQHPHSFRPISQLKNKSSKLKRVQPFKMKPKSVKFRISSKTKPVTKKLDSSMDIPDNNDREKTENFRHSTYTDSLSQSTLISGYSQEIPS